MVCWGFLTRLKEPAMVQEMVERLQLSLSVRKEES